MFQQAGPLKTFTFDPSQFGLFALPQQGNGATPIKPIDILNASGAVAALNGPMFGVCPGQNLPRGNAQYGVSSCDTLQYFEYDAGQSLNVQGLYASRGITISVVNGEATATSGGSFPSDASVAVQLYPALIDNGHIVASQDKDTDRVWRSGLAILSTGQLMFAVGQMSMYDFASSLADLGAIYAGYTDGGGSTAMVASGEFAGSSEGRPVPSWLIVRVPGSGGGTPASPGIGGLLSNVSGSLVQRLQSQPMLYVGGALVAAGLIALALRR